MRDHQLKVALYVSHSANLRCDVNLDVHVEGAVENMFC